MKYLFSFVFAMSLAVLGANTALAQTKTLEPDARLSQLYDADFLQRLQTLQPELLQRLNYYLDNSYSIVPMPEGKDAQGFLSIEMPADVSKFNVLAFERERKILRDKSQAMFFQIAGTRNLLMLLPELEFVKKFNEATGRVYAPRTSSK
jgi:hypothetical protein